MLSNPAAPSAMDFLANQNTNAVANQPATASHSLTPEEWKQLAQVAAVLLNKPKQAPPMATPQPIPAPPPIPLLSVPNNLGGS